MNSLENRAAKIKAELLNDTEIESLLKSFNDRYAVPHRNRTMIKLALRTGMRIDEIIHLKWSNIKHDRTDTGDGYYRLTLTHTKGGNKGNKKESNKRTVNIWPGMFVELKQQYDRFNSDSEFVFITHKGTMLTTAYCRQMIKKAAERAGIDKNVHFHSLRHIHLTALYRQQKDIAAVQRAAGHSNLNTTMIYVSVADEDVRDQQLSLYPEDK